MRMRATLLCLVALVLAALAVNSGAARADRGTPVAASCPEAPEARYFPVGALGPHWDEHDLFVRRWYSRHLAVMEEPSLSCGTLEDTETYRFLLLRSFHNSIAVRVFRRGDNYGLESVILDGGAWSYEPGHVSRRVTNELSHDQWRTVIAGLAEMQFWQVATRSNVMPGTGGARWIVEARRNGRYHVVDRWNGADGLGSVGRLFLDLAGYSMWGLCTDHISGIGTDRPFAALQRFRPVTEALTPSW